MRAIWTRFFIGQNRLTVPVPVSYSAIIAQFTGVSHGGGGNTVPVPTETIGVYGGVFKIIAISAVVSGVICLLISPILKHWMHMDEE